MDARRLATRFVSLAILAVGGAFVAAAVYLLATGGAAAILMGLVLGGIGLAIALAAFFFLLVPHRLNELKDMKDEYAAEHGEYKD